MNLIEYKNPEFSIRSAMIDGEPWFVAKDVCDALGIKNSRDSIARFLDDDERSDVGIADTRSKGGGTQTREMTVVSESGVYALIFQSRKPEARAFRRWVTHDVLPAIRRDGVYTLRALDMQRIMELEAAVVGTRQKLAQQVDAAWRARIIDGQFATRVYGEAAGVQLDKAGHLALCTLLRERRAHYRFACGYARVKRHARRAGTHAGHVRTRETGYARVRTWPPEHIAAALRELGIAFAEPNPTALAAADAVFRPQCDLRLMKPPASPAIDDGATPEIPAWAD